VCGRDQGGRYGRHRRVGSDFRQRFLQIQDVGDETTMRRFAEIFSLAAERKGGAAALEQILAKVGTI
jgi:hypothetical protein